MKFAGHRPCGRRPAWVEKMNPRWRGCRDWLAAARKQLSAPGGLQDPTGLPCKAEHPVGDDDKQADAAVFDRANDDAASLALHHTGLDLPFADVFGPFGMGLELAGKITRAFLGQGVPADSEPCPNSHSSSISSESNMPDSGASFRSLRSLMLRGVVMANPCSSAAPQLRLKTRFVRPNRSAHSGG
jgi:hypothetical protein